MKALFLFMILISTSVFAEGSFDMSDGAVQPGTAANKSSLSGAQYNSGGITLTDKQQAALQFDSVGNLKTLSTVSGSVTVTGTVTANQGTPNSNANGWPVKVTDGTNTLGTGANPFVVTGSGTAGTPASGVVTIQGIAGGTTIATMVGGNAVSSTFTQNYASINLTTGAFTTIITSTPTALDAEDIFDTSAGDFYLAYAASCGALSNAANAIIVSPGGGVKTFKIPTGQCVGFEAKTANLVAGFVNMTFYQ